MANSSTVWLREGTISKRPGNSFRVVCFPSKVISSFSSTTTRTKRVGCSFSALEAAMYLRPIHLVPTSRSWVAAYTTTGLTATVMMISMTPIRHFRELFCNTVSLSSSKIAIRRFQLRWAFPQTNRRSEPWRSCCGGDAGPSDELLGIVRAVGQVRSGGVGQSFLVKPHIAAPEPVERVRPEHQQQAAQQ